MRNRCGGLRPRVANESSRAARYAAGSAAVANVNEGMGMGNVRVRCGDIGLAALKRWAWLALALMCAVSLPWAAHAGDKVKVKSLITSTADLNPDFRGRPSPV